MSITTPDAKVTTSAGLKFSDLDAARPVNRRGRARARIGMLALVDNSAPVR
ncbi:hypothetical protein M1L60_14185 [Actinoplanes sp. TRM 88003]|uniref:Uncharacterized protein n=1 Tax=Paractinoplanes aksuensis TaxID=2939490 RepID=A0ABT1DLN0_9ACTN|nr:hypothetical protein [Actinoplanes aksuensis]MCO8271742.1 hypothetical protein [Actinoplanes aksuensis]